MIPGEPSFEPWASEEGEKGGRLPSLHCPVSVSKILAALMSLWMMFFECR